jgi:hypothetical protein
VGKAFQPGEYLTNGKRLLWVERRIDSDTLLVENARTYDRTEMGDGDLVGWRLVKLDDDEQPKSGSRLKANRKGSGSGGS